MVLFLFREGWQTASHCPCCGGDLDPETDDGKLVVSVKCGEFVGDIPARAALQQDRRKNFLLAFLDAESHSFCSICFYYNYGEHA